MIMSACSWKNFFLSGVVLAELVGWVLTAIGLSFTTKEFARNGAPISLVLPMLPLYLTAVTQLLAMMVLLPSVCPLMWKPRDSHSLACNKCFTAIFSGCFLFIATLSVCYILLQALLHPPFRVDTTSLINLTGTGMTVICHAVLTLHAVCCVHEQTDEKTKIDDNNEKIYLLLDSV